VNRTVLNTYSLQDAEYVIDFNKEIIFTTNFTFNYSHYSSSK